MQGAVVGLEREEVVGTGEVNFLRASFLAAHGIEADGGAFQIELAQEHGCGGDFVFLPVDEELAEDAIHDDKRDAVLNYFR